MSTILFQKVKADWAVDKTKSDTDPNSLIAFVYIKTLSAKDLNQIKPVRNELLKLYEIKDLGELKWFLVINIKRDRDKVTLSQVGYARKILERFHLNDCNPTNTHTETGIIYTSANIFKNKEEDNQSFLIEKP